MLLNSLQNLEDFENSLRNATFLTLFFTTIFYWIYTAFSTPTNYKTNNNLSVSNIIFARSCMAISNLLLVLLLVVRWDISGHFPLSNLYESLMFLAWCCTFLYLIYSTSFTISVEKILGSITAPSALLMNAFASFNLPKEMQQSAPLVPALQSNWLMMHVTVMIISYATLIIGSLLSILFLILNKLNSSKLNSGLKLTKNSSATLPPSGEQTNFYDKQKINTNTFNQLATENMALPAGGPTSAIQSIANDSSFPQGGVSLEGDLKFAPPQTQDFRGSGLTLLNLNLDSLSYRIIGLCFPFLTIGILSGAVWANEAWGSYWSWDPKETWALLTWLVFAIYLHTRLTKGWQGEKPAVIASLGFMVVWFCYLGVNLIGEGLHSYGFF